MREATARIVAVQRALEDLDGTIAELVELEAEPALAVLAEWAKLIDMPINTRKNKAAKAALKSPRVNAWKRAQGMLKPLIRKVESGKDPDSPDEIVGRMEALGGLFPSLLRAALTEAAGDPEATAAVLQSSLTYPGTWLAAEYFGWSAD